MISLDKISFKLLSCLVTVFLTLTIPRVLAYYSLGKPAGHVNDYVGVLTLDQISLLNNKLDAFDKETSNQIAVVIIKNLDGDTIENFAVKLFEEWKIGTAKNDNGVLLLISIDDRKMRIEVGYGLEGALTDLQSSWIINNELTPNFKKGDYYIGIDSAVDKIIAATKGEYVGETTPSEFGSLGKTIWNIFAVLFFFGWIIYSFLDGLLGSTKSWWFGGVLGVVLALIIGAKNGLVDGLIGLAVFVPLGLLIDFLLSKFHKPERWTKSGSGWGRSSGGFFSGSSGGSSFGGFGGGTRTGRAGPFTYTYTTTGGDGGNPFVGFDFGDPFDIFEQFFGGASPFRQARQVPRYSVKLDFMEAIKGVTKEVVVQGRKRKIKIPGGVDEGSRINFGDFILSINVKPHEVFERDGDDIFVRVAIPYSLAALGGEIKVPTVDGDVKIRIRPGTQPGTMVRLREKGVPLLHGRGRGDEYVRINVLVPEKLSKEQRKLMEDLKKEGL